MVEKDMVKQAYEAVDRFKEIERAHMIKLVDLAGELYEKLKEIEKAYNKVSCELKKYCKKEELSEIIGDKYAYKFEQYEIEVVDPFKLYDKYGSDILGAVNILVSKCREMFGDGYKDAVKKEIRERGKIEKRK